MLSCAAPCKRTVITGRIDILSITSALFYYSIVKIPHENISVNSLCSKCSVSCPTCSVGLYNWLDFTTSLVATIVVIILLSYSFVIQPHSSPQDEIPNQLFVTPENSYIVAYEDGSYVLIVDGIYFVNIQEEDLKITPNNTLEIIYETEKKQ